MPSINLPHNIRTILAALCLALYLFPGIACGEDDEETAGLFTAWEEASSTASRAPKPLSQTAENVTVVTAREIKQLNAHTLADVLDTIPGIQVLHVGGGPGSFAMTRIQSTSNGHTLIMVDGVPFNSLAENIADISSIPARIIERIDIVKGAASTAWSQAPGGVINVITKAPDDDRIIGGTASASIGGHTTADGGAELSGTSGKLGYYFSGGYLGSDGLRPHISTYSNNAYAKLTYDLPERGQLWGTFRYTNANRGDVFLPDPAYDFQEKIGLRALYATMGYRRPLFEHLELELNARHASSDTSIFRNMISDGTLLQSILSNERVNGGSAKLVWSGETNLLVVGVEFENAEIKATGNMLATNKLYRNVNKSGFFLNDTINLGTISVAPGFRFDHTAISGDQYSTSLGVTWQLTDSTLLRGYTARGYSIPYMLVENGLSDKAWTTQFGVESSALPFIWMKGTLFRNDIWEMKSTAAAEIPTTERHITLGAEIEARTIPVLNTSLGAGWTFADTTQARDDSEVGGLPRHTVQLALRYDDKTFRALLTGRHIWWNSNTEPGINGRYYGLVWDLHLGATLLKTESSSLELFFSGHNLFNGNLYWIDVYPSDGRWFDGGLKMSF